MKRAEAEFFGSGLYRIGRRNRKCVKVAARAVCKIRLAVKRQNSRTVLRMLGNLLKSSKPEIKMVAEENKNANWLIMNGNRIQVKRKQFEKL